MKGNARKMLGAALAGAMACGAAGLAGCSAGVDYKFDATGSAGQVDAVLATDAADLERAVYKAKLESGASKLEAQITVAMLPALVDTVNQKIAGTGIRIDYSAASGDKPASYSASMSAKTDGKYHEDTIALYPQSAASSSEAQDAKDKLTDEEIAQLEELLGDKPLDIDFSCRVPVDTNSEKGADGKYCYKLSLTAHDLADIANGDKTAADFGPQVLYACFTDAAKTTSIVETSAKGGYTKDASLRIYTPGIISKVALGTADLGPTDAVNLGNEGKKALTVTLTNGNSKTVKVTYDKTAPTTNVKANKTYKKDVKVTFKDKVAGVKSAKLDGKSVKSGKKVAKKGSHKLVVTDKAGNKTSVKFKVR